MAAPVIPNAPSNLIATVKTSTRIDLSWQDNSNNEDSFRVERASSSAGPWSLISTVSAGVTSFVNSPLLPSTTYFYRVAAHGKKGISAYSNYASATTFSQSSDTIPPSIPTGLAASVVSSTQINLAWNASTDTGGSGLKGYKLYENGVLIATVTTLTYSRTGLQPSTQYSYRVAAYDVAGNTSVQSGAVLATTSGNCTSVTLSPTFWQTTIPDGDTLDVAINIGAGCAWTATCADTWVHFSASSGTGPTTITISIDANAFGTSRSGYVFIKGVMFVITQAGTGCLITLLPSSDYAPAAGAGKTLGIVTQNAQACPWTVSSDASWLHPVETSGSGPKEISYVVDPNSGALRTATLTVADHKFSVTQVAPGATAPGAPSSPAATALSASSVYLKWVAPTSVGSGGRITYHIFRNGTLIDTTDLLFFTDTGLADSTSYSYQVSALDSNGNESVRASFPAVATSAVRLLVVEHPEEPGSFRDYGGFKKKTGKLKVACVRVRYNDHTTITLPKSYFTERWLKKGGKFNAALTRESYGQVQFFGDAFDYVNLNISQTCNGYEVLQAVSAAVQAQLGVNLNAYDVILVDISQTATGCDLPPNTGLKSIAGVVPTVDGQHFWLNPFVDVGETIALSLNGHIAAVDDQQQTGLWEHELGRAFGFDDAQTIFPGDGTVLNTDRTKNLLYRYGNAYEPMATLGTDQAQHFFARNKEIAGWLKVEPITANGTYQLNPISQPDSAIKAFKIPCGDQVNHYYLEYRPEGNLSGFGKGVLAHLVTPAGGDWVAPFALLMAPTSSLADSMLNPQFRIGVPFVDPWTGFTITVTAQDSASATIVVAGLPVGDTQAPSVQILSPANGTSVSGAQPVMFSASDNKVVSRIEVFEDGKLIKNLCHPTFVRQIDFSGPQAIPALPPATSINTWFMYVPSSLGSHVLTVRVWDTKNFTDSTISITATLDTAPTHTVFLNPLDGHTVAASDQSVEIGFPDVPDQDVKLMRFYVDGKLSAFTHCNFFSPQTIWPDFTQIYGSWVGWVTVGNQAISELNANVTYDPFGFDPPPHLLIWKTQNEAPGAHVLRLDIEDFSGNVTTRTINVTVPG